MAALEAAYSFIRTRDRFANEVQAQLLSKQFAPADIERVIDYLHHKHVLKSEKAVAYAIAEQLANSKDFAPSRIAQELEARGASAEAIEFAIFNLPAEDELAAKALAGLKSKTLPQKARKLFALGYSEETIQSLLELP